MSGVVKDIRYAARQIVKNPGFAATVIVTIALGIAANSTIFSWIRSTLLEPIPAATGTGSLVSVTRGTRSISPTPPFSYLDLEDLRRQTRSLSGLLGYHDDWMALTSKDKPERVYGALTTANYFELLGVRTVLGRAFRPEEEKAPNGIPVAVISYTLWRTHFQGDPQIIGRPVEINLQPFTVIGVAPEGFLGCKTGIRTDLWLPISNDPLVSRSERIKYRDQAWLNVLAKLRPGVDRRGAEAELNHLMQQLVVQYPNDHRGPNAISLDPLWRSPFGANAYLYSSLSLLLGLAIAVLLLACANVATLLVMRFVSRRRELAVRLSLGASHWRIIRQLLLESLLLAVAGGALAMLLTLWSAGTFSGFIPRLGSPITLNGRMDATVALVTAAVSVFAGMLFGVIPALKTSSLDPGEVLKQEAGNISAGVNKTRLSSALVVAQIALSLVLLLCAGLFLETLRNTERANPGFNPDHVLLASIELGPAGYSRANTIRFQQALLEALEKLPGVQSAAMADWVPLTLTRRTIDIYPDGYVPQRNESMQTRFASISADYFQTMQIPILAGRSFRIDDKEDSQLVSIVDEEMAARYWPGQDPLGRRLRIGLRWFTVVGLARNSRHFWVNEQPEPIVYLPLTQFSRSTTIIHVKTTVQPQSLVPAMIATVHSLDSGLAVFDVTTLRSSMQLASISARVGGVFVGAFGLIALALATVGIYGVVAYSTRQRTHEIGIRLALGASQFEVLRMVLGQGLRLTAAGLIAGLAISVLVTRLIRGALFGVSPLDPLTLAAVSLLLAAVAFFACLIPARRAIRTDPMAAVRCE